MDAKFPPIPRAAGLLTGALLALASLRAADTDAFPVFDNYITFSGLGVGASGDKAAFQARTWDSRSGQGGIEDFRSSRDLDKTTTLQIDGHALFLNEDYLAHVRVSREEVGSFDAGYQRFRTYYDGVGGFFPVNGSFFALPDQNLHVDRSKLWAEGTIALPNAPVFHLRYSSEIRNGQKDSTIWGDSDMTGIPISSLSSLNLISANRKLVPAWLQLDERHQSYEGSMTHTIGATRIELAVTGDHIDNLDTRFMSRNPGELKPFPAIPSRPITLVPPGSANNWTRGFDQQGITSDSLTFLAKFETVLSDKLSLHGGFTQQHTDAGISADREMTVSIATGAGVENLVGGYTAGGRPPYSYQTLGGSVKSTTAAGNIGLDYRPMTTLYIGLAVKGENFSSDANNPVNYTNQLVTSTTTGAVTSLPLSAPNWSKIKGTSWTPELDLRYTGIRNVVLYATGDFRHAPGDQSGSSTGVNPVGSTITGSIAEGYDKTLENHGNYKVGANLNPLPYLTLRAEGFIKSHSNAFYGYGTEAGGRFVLNYDLKGAKLSATFKPVATISSTTRFVVQDGTMNVAADESSQYDSGFYRSQQIGETIDWNPTREFYLQLNGNVVFDVIRTAYPRAGGAANGVLHNANNNYWTASAVAGFVVDKSTDLQAEYTYYSCNNYQPALAATTMPYGAGGKEYTATLGLKHKFSDRLVGSAKIGYYSSRNDTTGGFTNFNARLAYISLEYKL